MKDMKNLCNQCKKELDAEDYFLSVHTVCKKCTIKNYSGFVKRGL